MVLLKEFCKISAKKTQHITSRARWPCVLRVEIHLKLGARSTNLRMFNWNTLKLQLVSQGKYCPNSGSYVKNSYVGTLVIQGITVLSIKTLFHYVGEMKTVTSTISHKKILAIYAIIEDVEIVQGTRWSRHFCFCRLKENALRKKSVIFVQSMTVLKEEEKLNKSKLACLYPFYYKWFIHCFRWMGVNNSKWLISKIVY